MFCGRVVYASVIVRWGYMRMIVFYLGDSFGIWSHVWFINVRPVDFLFTPPHCLKKNGTLAW